MKKKPFEPTPKQALWALNKLLSTATWPEIDATTNKGAEQTLARWAMSSMAIQTLRKFVREHSSKL